MLDVFLSLSVVTESNQTRLPSKALIWRAGKTYGLNALRLAPSFERQTVGFGIFYFAPQSLKEPFIRTISTVQNRDVIAMAASRSRSNLPAQAERHSWDHSEDSRGFEYHANAKTQSLQSFNV
jgi:hypothetical protein